MIKITNTHEFSKNNCYVASLVAKAVYDLGELNELSQELGMDCYPFPAGNHFAAILRRSDFAIIAYRGTDDLADFFDDLKYFQDRLAGTPMMVHRGVNRGYKDLQRKMAPELHKIFVSDSKWIVTGHSLGGGLAVRSLINNRNPNGHAYTYGAMRVGNDKIFNNINVPITRVVRMQDAVTDLPKEHMIISGCEYKHKQDRLIHLGLGGEIIEGGMSLWGEVKEHIAGIAGDVVDTDLIPYKIEHHFVDGYCADLAQWEGQ